MMQFTPMRATQLQKRANVPAGLRQGGASRLPAGSRVIVRFQKDEDKPSATSGSPAMGKKVDKLVEELKKTGMTAQKAKQVLKAWADAGVKDPAALGQLLRKKALAPVPGLALQALFDATASFGGYYLAGLASSSENFPFRWGVEILGYFFFLYYGIQVVLGLTVTGGLVYTSYKYGMSSGELLTAVQAMAGPTSGVGIVDKASAAVNILKVVNALESVASMLRDEFKDPPKTDSLRNLGAYLTLAQARETLGFKPEDYGLDDKQAGNIAYAFSTYDINQNFKLEPNELRALCSSLGKDLSNDEIKEAVKILDTNNNGMIEFTEFVAWWVKKSGHLDSLPADMKKQESSA